MEQEMRVTKRNGKLEEVSFDKILKRVKKLGSEVNPPLTINYSQLIMKVIDQLYDKIHTTVIDELTAEQCASLSTKHLDYGALANRIIVSNNHKNTLSSFTDSMEILYNFKDVHGSHKPLIDTGLWNIIKNNRDYIDSLIDYKRDYLFDYFGFKTLERAYLMHVNNKIIERPQHMWMRVALGIHGNNFENVKETYDLMSTKYFTHATPTLFNSGTPRPQLSSCYLIGMESDSIDGIYNTVKDCAKISKWAGGIGLHIHNIRASGTHIAGTNGTSNGIVPMLSVFNKTARYVDQCFTPNTVIYTQNGPKCIQDISIGDKILNSNGTYVNVNLPVRHEYKGKMLNITIKNGLDTIRVTPEHQVFSLKSQIKGLNFDIIKKRLDNNIIKPEFCDAIDLEPTDLMVFPIPTYELDYKEFTEDDCRFYGILIRDGYISNNISEVCLNNTTNLSTVEFVKQYLTDKCIKFYSYEEHESLTIRIKWSHANPMFKFVKSQLYDSNHIKKIDPLFLHLPINKIKKVIYGLLETDYCIGTKEITIEMNSYNVIESLRYMLLRLGALSSGYKRNRIGNLSSYKNNTTHKETYVLRIPRIKEILDLFPNAPTGEYVTFMIHNNHIYSHISTISETFYNGIVHDFEVEYPHDYVVAHLGIVHNGGGKRNGSFAIYLEPWHSDINEFLDLKKNHGDEEMRARDLFYALWIPDLFMEKVKNDQEWGLFCPHKCPGLSDCYGKEFNELYEKYMSEGKANKVINARELWFKILDSQMETGTPYLLYKDAANRKSNQKNLGTIKSSNLCVAPETTILTDKGYIEIKSLEGKNVNVWNGEEWSNVNVVKTNDDELLIRITMSDGSFLECTKYHKFYIQAGDSNNKHNKMKIAMNLNVGDCLIPWTTPKLLGTKKTYNMQVASIEEHGRRSPTYCFNEPKRHMGIFNGIITGNCTEIIEYSDDNETAVCNLASIGLSMFVRNDKSFDYDKLHYVTKVVTKNLNKIIDINFYPTEKTRLSNLLHRPIGIGVQGLADTYALMDIPFHSEQAREINKLIFETIYHAALEMSNEIAIERYKALNDIWILGPKLFTNKSDLICNIYDTDYTNNLLKEKQEILEKYRPINAEINKLGCKRVGSYSSFEDSPASHGILQFDMWNVTPNNNRYNWTSLKDSIIEYGLRNSLLIAPMPTASTSQILGNNECFEPFTSNIYSRRTLAGEFVIVNKYLMKELIDIGLWTEELKDNIILNKGSIQHIQFIPQHIRDKYKIVWEIPMKHIIDMAADRGAYICQSQSLNLWMEDPDYKALTSMHFYSWQAGLKTGIYYLRRKAKHQAQQFTIAPKLVNNEKILDDEPCEMCSS